MSDAISDLRRDFDDALAAARTAADVKDLRDRFLSRKNGRVTALLKALGTLPADARREAGQQANQLK